MDAMSIDYTYLDDNVQRYGTWTGPETRALQAAIEYLGAIEHEDGYAYLAEETGEWYRVSREDMLEAGAAILADRGDWYSLWCAGCGEQMAPCQMCTLGGVATPATTTREAQPGAYQLSYGGTVHLCDECAREHDTSERDMEVAS